MKKVEIDNIEKITFKPKEADLLKVVSSVVPLEKNEDGNYTGNCPFESEEGRQFIVFPNLNRFKCYHCNMRGGVFGFIEAYHDCDSATSALYLADMVTVTFDAK